MKMITVVLLLLDYKSKKYYFLEIKYLKHFRYKLQFNGIFLRLWLLLEITILIKCFPYSKNLDILR